MNFSNEKSFLAHHNKAVSRDVENEKELTKEEVLNSNDVELVVKYAKENRSQEAINKARQLLELARRAGEEVVQAFLRSFKECQAQKINYINFEDTVNGRLALSSLNEMPEPFKTNAYKKLASYKEELARNIELFEKHKNHPEEIWKEVFGFDYYNIPDFKERFKTFLFKDIGSISSKYYKNNGLEVSHDPFAINFFVEDRENFNRARGKLDDVATAFSTKKDKINVNVIEAEKGDKTIFTSSSRENIHEKEHSIHRITKPFDSMLFDDGRFGGNSDFLGNVYLLNNHVKWDYEERLKKAEDEIFAYFKNKDEKGDVEYFLSDKSEGSPYDYSNLIRQQNDEEINNNTIISEIEKRKLRDGIDFLQSEYDRVLKNMIDVVYSQNESVEYLRNLPIKEWYKATNGKYKRTDFIIREFKP